MQEKVTSGQGPAPITPKMPIAQAKTSDEKFQDISDYVWTSTQSSILRETLLHLEILSQQAEPSQKPLDFLPKDPISQRVYAKAEVATELIPTLQKFLEKGDYASLLAALKPFVEGKRLPRGTDESVNTLLAPFLNARLEPTGPTLGEIALKDLIKDPESLRAIAHQDPSSPLSLSAQNLLENPDISTTFDSKSFNDIFTKNRLNLRAIPLKLQAASSVPSLYQSYNEELKDEKLTTESKERLLPVISAQMNYLKKALDFLMQATAKAPETADFAARLAKIKFPPTNDDREAIKTLGHDIFETYETYKNQGKITQEQHQKFLDLTKESLNQMDGAILSQRKNSSDLLGKIQDQVDQTDEADDLIDKVEDFLKKGGDPGSFASILSDLSLSYRNQTPEIQRRIDDLFQEISTLKTTDNENLSKVVAESLVDSLIKQYQAAKGDNPNMMPLKDWLQQQNMPKMNNDFIKNLLQEVQILINTMPTASKKKKIAFEDSAVQTSLVKVNALQNALDETTDQQKAQIDGTKGAMRNLDSIKTSVDNAKQVIETKKAIAEEEVPDVDFSGSDIVKVLDKLNKMMDAEMQNVAYNLSNANAVRTSLTNLMSFLVNFPNANAAYGLGQWLTSQTVSTDPTNPNNKIYNVTPSIVIARCSQELSDAKAAQASVQGLMAPVQKLIAFLNNLKASMGKNFPPDLQKSLDDMNTMSTSLQKLNYYLSPAQLQGNLSEIISEAKNYATAHPGATTVSINTQRVEWQTYIEKMVVNGNYSTTDPSSNFSGLINLHDMVQTDSQNLAMLSQSEQMNVQLNFTEMSQYWQAITQLISKLHDIFNSPIQALKTS